jgi:GAF domain-containing protein
LEKAHSLCGAAHGSLQLYDGENLRAVATHAVSNKFTEVLQQGYRAADSPASRALIEGQPFVQIADCVEIDHPVFRSAAQLSGIHTVLFVPLRKEGAFLGLISAARLEVRPFTDKQIALLENFAAQAVIAMENARLLTETREALEQQTATAEVLGVINSSPGNLAPVFSAMLEKAMALCGAAFGVMNIHDGEVFRPAADRGIPVAYAEFRERHPLVSYGPGTAPARLLGGEEVVHNVDLKAEEAYALGEPQRRAIVDLGGARSHVAVALRRDRVFLGYLAVYRQEVRPFSVSRSHCCRTSPRRR